MDGKLAVFAVAVVGLILALTLYALNLNSQTAKACSEYTCPMTETQIQECACPAGQQKFTSMCGAYCATDSQKLCSSHTDCPNGEKCISRDGQAWTCTGQWAGCYYDNPDNPKQQICID